VTTQLELIVIMIIIIIIIIILMMEAVDCSETSKSFYYITKLT